MIITNDYLAVLLEKVEDVSTNATYYSILPISLIEYEEGKIDEKLTLGSSMLNNWNDLINDYEQSWSIVDYDSSSEVRTFTKQKILSGKDKKVLRKLTEGSVFTFQLSIDVDNNGYLNKSDKLGIFDNADTYQVKNIKIYSYQYLGEAISFLIYNNKLKHYLGEMNKEHINNFGISLKNTNFEILLHKLSPLGISLYFVCSILVHQGGRIYVDEIIDYTQWDLEDITQGLDELSSCGYVLDLIDDKNNQTLSNYYFRKNICLNEDDDEIQMEE